MRILALDPGTVRIGVAISDELKIIAQPLEFILAEPRAGFMARLGQLLREKEVELVLVGMPRNMDGTYGPAAERVRQGRILAEVMGRVRDVRRVGSAALDLAYVAAGRADLYFESVSKPWDWVAGALLVREAGGRVTELTSATGGEPRIIASGARIHEAALALLREAVQNSTD